MTSPARLLRARGPEFGHAGKEEYRGFLRRRGLTDTTIQNLMHQRSRFVRTYPDLRDWFAAPLPERVGRLWGETRSRATCLVSFRARSYLYYLAHSGRASYDYEWLIAIHRIYARQCLGFTSLGGSVEELAGLAAGLGYKNADLRDGLWLVASRLYLHTPDPTLGSVGEDEISELVDALHAFGRRADVESYFGSARKYEGSVEYYRTCLYALQMMLYHRGQVHRPPSKGSRSLTAPARPRNPARPRMEEMKDRYIAQRRLRGDRPSTLGSIERAIDKFVGWVASEHPEVDSFAAVTRDHALEYARWLHGAVLPGGGRALSESYKLGLLSCLNVFFREIVDWGWGGAPPVYPLCRADLPRRTYRVPRYIPAEELRRLMVAIRALPCPFQRTALLVARWSGARRDEIRRLPLDCLDSYPDGTPRLRIPVGKGKAERLIPLNEEAAAAIRELQALVGGTGGRGLREEQTGEEVRHLFVHHGRVYSLYYLFDTPLKRACEQAGLVAPDGRHTASAHRFRHTVGTELAERNAKLRTIMSILGHVSADMSLVYARISDETVLKDYQAVLGPGAEIAGPLAETLRHSGLPEADVEWIKGNFFETELELGHCLRLPQEGPCECDLYLSCAKFVTTREYAPRLRARRSREFELVEDAISRGWAREAERHRCTIRRIEQLLADLGETLGGEWGTDGPAGGILTAQA